MIILDDEFVELFANFAYIIEKIKIYVYYYIALYIIYKFTMLVIFWENIEYLIADIISCLTLF